MTEYLTIKQEAFCLAYLETGNASAAYRRAYNAGRMKTAAVHVSASRLLGNAKVALRIRELRAVTVERGIMSRLNTVAPVARWLFTRS